MATSLRESKQSVVNSRIQHPVTPTFFDVLVEMRRHCAAYVLPLISGSHPISLSNARFAHHGSSDIKPWCLCIVFRHGRAQPSLLPVGYILYLGRQTRARHYVGPLPWRRQRRSHLFGRSIPSLGKKDAGKTRAAGQRALAATSRGFPGTFCGPKPVCQATLPGPR